MDSHVVCQPAPSLRGHIEHVSPYLHLRFLIHGERIMYPLSLLSQDTVKILVE